MLTRAALLTLLAATAGTLEAQSQSGRVVSASEHTSAYDAFMKVNRFKEAPGPEETADDYWGNLKTRLHNQAGRNLIKRPAADFSEDAFFGWLHFVRAYGEAGVGNCVACHRAPDFTDGQDHKITDTGTKTPSLRELSGKTAYLRDGSATTLEEAIDKHLPEEGATADPELTKISLTEVERRQIAAFLDSLKSVDRARFRRYLIDVVIQPLELEP